MPKGKFKVILDIETQDEILSSIKVNKVIDITPRTQEEIEAEEEEEDE